MKITHVHYQETIENCKRVALPIDGSVNMQNPKVVFAITKIEDTWYFGIYHDEVNWSDHYEKPHSYSHSLNLRDARTIVNIAVGNDLSLKVIDPCCGVGTVVLEALSMGIDIEGYDINRYVSYQARLNLEHYGYDPLVIQKQDMLTIDKKYDVTIIDIPYGVYSPFSYEQQLELLKGTLSLAPKLLLVSHIPMNQELETMGYTILDRAMIKKRKFSKIHDAMLSKSDIIRYNKSEVRGMKHIFMMKYTKKHHDFESCIHEVMSGYDYEVVYRNCLADSQNM